MLSNYQLCVMFINFSKILLITDISKLDQYKKGLTILQENFTVIIELRDLVRTSSSAQFQYGCWRW